MKVRDSGMPEADYWNSFFDADCVIRKMLGESGRLGNIVEFGCGYGTFTFPAARCTAGTVFALDIEAGLIGQLRQRMNELGIGNIHAEVCDFLAAGTGLDAQSQSHAMIYNLLHLEHPLELLKEAFRVLQKGGRLSVMHWSSDIPTPRGPALDIRPTPDQCREWIEAAGFQEVRDVDLSECCPFHFGIIAAR